LSSSSGIELLFGNLQSSRHLTPFFRAILSEVRVNLRVCV
jgi:hypothetical protein